MNGEVLMNPPGSAEVVKVEAKKVAGLQAQGWALAEGQSTSDVVGTHESSGVAMSSVPDSDTPPIEADETVLDDAEAESEES